MKKIILLAAIICMPAMLLNAATIKGKNAQPEEVEVTFVDLGLPSGTLWAEVNEEEFYTFHDAVDIFGKSLPTKAQWEELKETCRWIWDRKAGCILIGPNGKRLTFPILGYYNCDGEFRGKGEFAEYWTSTDNVNNPMNAWIFDIEANLYVCDLSFQCYRLSVRLVKNKQ